MAVYKVTNEVPTPADFFWRQPLLNEDGTFKRDEAGKVLVEQMVVRSLDKEKIDKISTFLEGSAYTSFNELSAITADIKATKNAMSELVRKAFTKEIADNTYINITEDQDVIGKKNFLSGATVTMATIPAANDVVNKGYIDKAVGSSVKEISKKIETDITPKLNALNSSAMHLTGTERVTGRKDFVEGLTTTMAENASENEVVNKRYIDDIYAELKGKSDRDIGELITLTFPTDSPNFTEADGKKLGKDGIYDQFVEYMVTQYNKGYLKAYSYTANNATSTIFIVGDTLNEETELLNADGSQYTGADFTVTKVEDKYEIRFKGNTCTRATGSDKQISKFFTTNAQYESDVKQFGCCAKYVYDASAGTIRLPLIYDTRPKESRCYVYVVVANSSKLQLQVDLDNYANDLNNKVSKDDLVEARVVVEFYKNGRSWFRRWSDGWLEQGGEYTGADNKYIAITFLKNYTEKPFVWINRFGAAGDDGGTVDRRHLIIRDIQLNHFNAWGAWGGYKFNWHACGYAG